MIWLMGLMVLALIALWLYQRQRLPAGHRQRIKTADACLERLAQLNSPAQQFGYLRTLDPFVFEEMILTALQQLGHPVTRNRRYTGDDGADGECRLEGHRVLIQAKRYKRHIRAEHVKDFADLCQHQNCRGLFVHTGRTGQKAWQQQAPQLCILSGQRLLKLLLGQSLEVRWQR